MKILFLGFFSRISIALRKYFRGEEFVVKDTSSRDVLAITNSSEPEFSGFASKAKQRYDESCPNAPIPPHMRRREQSSRRHEQRWPGRRS